MGVNLRLDDSPISAINFVRQEATNKVKMYLLPRYGEANLQANADAGGMVNDMATTLAVCALCRRRGNPVPRSLLQHCEEAMKDLDDIRSDMLQLPGVDLRHPNTPAFSNIRVIPGYEYKRIRVEFPTSEGTAPVGYVQAIDWRSLTFLEY